MPRREKAASNHTSSTITPMPNIILSNIKKAFSVLWQHKVLAIFIILIQVLYVFLMIASQALYQEKILVAQGDLLNYLDAIDSDEGPIDNPYAQALGEDPLLIIAKLNEMKAMFASALAIAFLIYVLLNGLLWSLSAVLISKRASWKLAFKSAVSYYLKFILVSIILFIPLMLFFAILITNNFFVYQSEQILILLGTLLVLLLLLTLYFVQIAYSLLSSTSWNFLSFLKALKKGFIAGVMKAGVIAFVFLINLAVLSLSASLLIILLSAESSFYLYLLLASLCIFSFVWTRIFYLLCVDVLNRRS